MKYVDKDKRITPQMCFDKIKTNGRPRYKLNELGAELVESLARCFCTEEEIAAVLDVNLDTLKRPENREAFAECIKKGQESGKSTLRQRQFRAAMNGSITMLIWLGKQYLGQSDEVELTGDNEIMQRVDDMTAAINKQAAKIAKDKKENDTE